MNFFQLAPDVPGDLGDATHVDASTRPPTVLRLHLDVTNWSGDDLVECFPCYAVTPRLADALRRSSASGVDLRPMVTSVNPDQREINPERRIPQFVWLHVNGLAGRDDVGLDAQGHLVVSGRLWTLLQSFQLSACDSMPWG